MSTDVIKRPDLSNLSSSELMQYARNETMRAYAQELEIVLRMQKDWMSGEYPDKSVIEGLKILAECVDFICGE